MVGEDRVGKERGTVEKEREREGETQGERELQDGLFLRSLSSPRYTELWNPGAQKRCSNKVL